MGQLLGRTHYQGSAARNRHSITSLIGRLDQRTQRNASLLLWRIWSPAVEQQAQGQLYVYL